MDRENRMYRRMQVKLIANCAKSENDSQKRRYFLSVVKDISPAGARIILPQEIKAGERLSIALEIPAYFIPILVHSEVIWGQTRYLQANKIRNIFEAGIKFYKIEPLDEMKLREYLVSKEISGTHSRPENRAL